MFQLVIVVISIALTAALVLASVNYIPWWTKSASNAEHTARTSMAKLENAYDATTRSAGGVSPATTAEADGGLATNFRSVLTFMPPPVLGATWKYGQHASDGSRYAGLHYFCLSTTAGDRGLWVGLNRAKTTYSPEQVFLGSSCGSPVNGATPDAYPAPVALTMYVAYTPAIVE